MKAKLIKTILSVSVAAALVLVSPGVSAAAANMQAESASGNEAVIKNKEEVVYANLASDGSADAVCVVNHFVVSEPGNVTDYGSYSSLENLTTTDTITQNEETVSFYTDKDNFYYKGNMVSTDLPWIFHISYYIDGVKTETRQIAGKSGKLEIRIGTSKNEKINSAFYDNYMLQVSMTLDTEKCGNIEAPGATIASSGKNTVVNYMIMPGEDGDISLSSTVRDFTMEGIQVSAIPLKLGIKIPDTGEMVGNMYTLSDAISDLNDGVKNLNSGVAELKNGAKNIVNGSSEFNSGLTQLSGSSVQITQASGQISAALNEIVASLNNSGLDFSDLAQLPDGLLQISQGLSGISAGLTQLESGLINANSALSSSISAVPDISQSAIESLSGSPSIAGLDESQRSTFNQLLAAYIAAQTVKGTYFGPHGNDGVKAAFDSVAANLGVMTGSINVISQNLSDMSVQIKNSNITGQMQQLIDGLTALSNNYGQFNSGLIEYTNGLKELSSNYGMLHAGLASLSEGTADLYKGTQELYTGTSKMNNNVADLPEKMKSEIDNLMKDYDKSDFQPVSFVSDRNTNVSLVQFVFKTHAIENIKETADAEPEKTPKSLWDRFLELF